MLVVIILHVLANIPNAFQLSSPWWRWAVLLDQLSRFSVPLFVLLSGYSFWKKYQQVKCNCWQFWRHQAAKLLPLYILASLIFYVIFLLVPQWRNPEAPRSFMVQLLTGQADYQLYFIPMIFQLYLLFPLVRWVVQKLPWITLERAGVSQVWLYLFHMMVFGGISLEEVLKEKITLLQKLILSSWFKFWI